MLLSIDQVAERAGVHPSTLRRWLKAGLQQGLEKELVEKGREKGLEKAGPLPKPLPVKAIGGGPLWRESDIDRWRTENIKGLPVKSEDSVRPRLALVQ